MFRNSILLLLGGGREGDWLLVLILAASIESFQYPMAAMDCSRCYRMADSAAILSCRHWRLSPCTNERRECYYYTTEDPISESFSCQHWNLARATHSTNRKQGNEQRLEEKYSGWSECDYTYSDWSESKEDKLDRRESQL
jgi:hypothetical protein